MNTASKGQGIFDHRIMNKWATMASEHKSLFLKDKLDQLGKRGKEIETGILALQEMLEGILTESVAQGFKN